MDLALIQQFLQRSDAGAAHPFRSAAEIVLALTEELGEVATEVALLERIGSKAGWTKEASPERLEQELLHLLNLAFNLANRYGIDLDQAYSVYLNQAERDPHANGIP